MNIRSKISCLFDALDTCVEEMTMIYYGYKGKSSRQLTLTTAVSKTNGLLDALVCTVRLSAGQVISDTDWKAFEALAAMAYDKQLAK